MAKSDYVSNATVCGATFLSTPLHRHPAPAREVNQVVEVAHPLLLCKMNETARVAVIMNSSHSAAPMTVAALSAPHETYPPEHAPPPILTATAIQPANHESSATSSIATRT
jgi:hypothetical protein